MESTRTNNTLDSSILKYTAELKKIHDEDGFSRQYQNVLRLLVENEEAENADTIMHRSTALIRDRLLRLCYIHDELKNPNIDESVRKSKLSGLELGKIVKEASERNLITDYEATELYSIAYFRNRLIKDSPLGDWTFNHPAAKKAIKKLTLHKKINIPFIPPGKGTKWEENILYTSLGYPILPRHIFSKKAPCTTRSIYNEVFISLILILVARIECLKIGLRYDEDFDSYYAIMEAIYKSSYSNYIDHKEKLEGIQYFIDQKAWENSEYDVDESLCYDKLALYTVAVENLRSTVNSCIEIKEVLYCSAIFYYKGILM